MRQIWHNAYPSGVPWEVDVHAYGSLKQLLESSCTRFANKAAFANMGVELTYRDLDDLSCRFAAYFQKVLGLSKGDRVAIMLPNLLQYPVALFGALRAGLTVVNINPLYTATELVHPLADSGAIAIVVLENFAQTLERVLPRTQVRHVITTQVGDLFPSFKRWLVNVAVKMKGLVPGWHIVGARTFGEALRLGATNTLDNVLVVPEDIAFLQYTGGTTGRPKAAMLTHANMVANVEQTAAWIGLTMREGTEIVISALPLYHVFALTANLLVFLRLGGKNVLITNPRDIQAFVGELKKVRFTAITGVNTLFRALLDAPGFDQVAAINRGALKVAVAGGMAVQRVVAERWQEVMGVPLIEGYGLTEASPNVCANPLDAKEFNGKIGLPLPSTAVAILDEHGNALPLGEIGEICVRGPQVMRGYWNAPKETAKVLGQDGWLRTGDLGWMDAKGFVEFTDRSKDVIVVSGFKVYPAEVEQIAMLRAGVKEAGAVGVPDERTGEAVALYVVRTDPTLTAEALRAHCAQHLTPYKVPKRIAFCEQLPKTPIGKVSHRELKEPAHRQRWVYVAP